MGKGRPATETRNTEPDATLPAVPPWMRWFIRGVLACAGLLALWALTLALNRAGDASRFAEQGWGKYAAVIVGNKIRALWHGALMTFCAGGGLWILLSKRSARLRRMTAWGLVLIVAFDAWLLSRHYVKTMPMSALAENEVIRILKKDMPEHRVALVSQDGFYNWWLTYLFPYHDIKTINITQMPRMPTEYKNFLGAVGRNPIRYWQLAAVGYVLSPATAWTQIQKDPAMQGTFELVHSYNVAQAEAGVTVVPASPAQPGQHVVLRLKKPGPRFALIAGWDRAEDDKALSQLASARYPLLERVLVAPESAEGLPPIDGRGIVGSVSLKRYRPGRMELSTDADQPAVLRVSEKYDRDWKAAVDGQPAKVLRVDYIFQGLMVPSGRHEIVLRYAPSVWPLGLQAAGMLICVGAAAWLAGMRFLRRKVPGDAAGAQ